MLKQSSLPTTPSTASVEVTIYEEVKYEDACTNWSCYLHIKDEEFGFCQIDKHQITHSLAQIQRVCDYKTRQELETEIKKIQQQNTFKIPVNPLKLKQKNRN